MTQQRSGSRMKWNAVRPDRARIAGARGPGGALWRRGRRPEMAPEWWEVAVGDGALLPVREEIDAHEAYAMRIYPAKHDLPGLALATFHLLDNVGSGPDVAKALVHFGSELPDPAWTSPRGECPSLTLARFPRAASHKV